MIAAIFGVLKGGDRYPVNPCWEGFAEPVSPPPHPLPAEHCKGQSGKGVGDTLRPATVLSHTVEVLVSVFPLLERGNAVRFFHFVFFVSGSVSFVVFLPFFSSKGRFLEKFSGANFCFWVLVLVLCFLVGFCLCFCFCFGGSLPKVSGKIL